MAYEQHQHAAEGMTARAAIVTLSDTRTESTDTSGRKIVELLESNRHHIGSYQIIKDDPAVFQPILVGLIGNPDIDIIFTNGGTGISKRDQTIDVVSRHIQQPLPGFGELFRMLSWEQIGSGAMLSRAVAGIASGKLIFAMPGSTKAVELAMTRLILPELRHLLFELRK